ncbi:MAG: penicillin-binding protein 2, partial [Actinomycetota bacterium]|nr:penicillin-binding protein 2 [Actinomycetota bacterium]
MIDRSLRHVVFVILGCFVILFVQLNRVQVLDAESLRQHPANTRTVQRDFNRARGPIVTSDGQVVAKSVASDGPFERQRQYPFADLYAHSAGYLSFNVGADGLERSFNDALVGRTASLQLGGLIGLLGEDDPTGEVVMTIRHDLQTVARDALGERKGSVVVLDPRTGAVLALWSWPSFDANALASHSGVEVNEAFAALNTAEGNPLRAATYRDAFFPGSTFKVVTAAAALSNGATLTSPVFEPAQSYTPPGTSRPLSNFGGATCGGDLVALLQVSCNTAFAELGAEFLGPSRLIERAQQFGFNSVPPFDLPGAVASRFPTDFGEELAPPSFELPAGRFENTPALAQASIGQNDVAASPLQMALVAAAIANDGVIMAPHVVKSIRDLKGDVVDETEPAVWMQAIPSTVAADLRMALRNVVDNGTARSAAVPGLAVGAKTGTAQLGTDPPRSHAWMIAFAGPQNAPPEVAVSVLVEGVEGSADQTGGRAAGPI